ncbi:hypothetical protein D3C78_1173380 [compost metagenome]
MTTRNPGSRRPHPPTRPLGAAAQPVRSTRLLLHRSTPPLKQHQTTRSGLVSRQGRAAAPTIPANSEPPDAQQQEHPAYPANLVSLPGRRHRQRRRLHPGQQGQSDAAELLFQPRLPRRHRPVQARGVGSGFPARPALRLHPWHSRLRPGRPGHAWHQARFKPRPCRLWSAAGARRWSRRRRVQPPGPDRQGQGVCQRVQVRHPGPQTADRTGQYRPHPAANLRGRLADGQGNRRLDLHRCALQPDDRPRLDQRDQDYPQQQEPALRRGR